MGSGGVKGDKGEDEVDGEEGAVFLLAESVLWVCDSAIRSGDMEF